MLENLLDLVKQHAGESVVENPAVPNDQNQHVMEAASGSIFNGLQDMLSQSGGMKDILRLFGGQQEVKNHPVTENITGGFVQNLVDQFGFDRQSAGSVANRLIPDVLGKLVHKTNDPGDQSFDIQGIFNSISGGKTSGMNLQGLLDKVKQGGFDLDGDGDTDLQDLLAAFNGKGGDVMDKIKGMFS
jgi:uncharacterized protein YidB (DUF937 family)